MYSPNEPPWVWRGQADASHDLTPGMHTRLGNSPDDARLTEATTNLLEKARSTGVDRHDGVKLPDMALLALLQHHGAATPLLDVSLDPLIAMYMATVSPNQADEEADGVVFAIRRPQTIVCQAMDSRSFPTIYSATSSDVGIYSGPDVSDRLRIQRGHFLMGPVTADRFRTTLPLHIEDPEDNLQATWLWKRMSNRGEKGVTAAKSDVAVFRIASGLKQILKSVLEDRSGLTADFVYPTAWHQPHLDEFCRAHGRTSPM